MWPVSISAMVEIVKRKAKGREKMQKKWSTSTKLKRGKSQIEFVEWILKMHVSKSFNDQWGKCLYIPGRVLVVTLKPQQKNTFSLSKGNGRLGQQPRRSAMEAVECSFPTQKPVSVQVLAVTVHTRVVPRHKHYITRLSADHSQHTTSAWHAWTLVTNTKYMINLISGTWGRKIGKHANNHLWLHHTY